MKRWLIAITFCLVTTVFAAETYDIVIKAGEDYRRTHTWSVKSTWVFVNLSGSSFQGQFRSAPYPNGTLYANFSTIVTSASTGQIRMSLSRRQTAALSGKAGVWDLQQTDAAGRVSYRYGGTCKVLPVVTEPKL